MSMNKTNPDKFDVMLEQTLRRYSPPTPPDFTRKMLNRIEQAREQQILARIVWQERLALGSSIALGVAAVIVAVFFPDAALNFVAQAKILINKLNQTRETVASHWQLYTVFALIFGLVVYNLVDLLIEQ